MKSDIYAVFGAAQTERVDAQTTFASTVAMTYTLNFKSDTLLTLYKIGKMPRLSAETLNTQEEHRKLVGALYKPGNKAYACNSLHYKGFQELSEVRS